LGFWKVELGNFEIDLIVIQSLSPGEFDLTPTRYIIKREYHPFPMNFKALTDQPQTTNHKPQTPNSSLSSQKKPWAYLINWHN